MTKDRRVFSPEVKLSINREKDFSAGLALSPEKRRPLIGCERDFLRQPSSPV